MAAVAGVIATLLYVVGWHAGLGDWHRSRTVDVELTRGEVVELLSSDAFVAEVVRTSWPSQPVLVRSPGSAAPDARPDAPVRYRMELADREADRLRWVFRSESGDDRGEWLIEVQEHDDDGTLVSMQFGGTSRGPLGVANLAGTKVFTGFAGRVLFECEKRLSLTAEQR